MGVEPTRYLYRRILSPLRLPFRHRPSGHILPELGHPRNLSQGFLEVVIRPTKSLPWPPGWRGINRFSPLPACGVGLFIEGFEKAIFSNLRTLVLFIPLRYTTNTRFPLNFSASFAFSAVKMVFVSSCFFSRNKYRHAKGFPEPGKLFFG